jgi:hypothetical protein
LFVNILAWYFPEKIKIKDIFHQFFFDPPYFSKPQLFEQLYRGCQFYWQMKLDYPEKTNDLFEVN